MASQKESNSWSIMFSANEVTSVAWSSSRRNEYASSGGTLYLLIGPDSQVYMVVIAPEPRDILSFDFGHFWSMTTTWRRWGSTVVTYHAQSNGLALIFTNERCMERFEESCDRIPSSPHACDVGPTIQDLADLGLIAVPRIVGNFLAGPAIAPSVQPEIAPGGDDVGANYSSSRDESDGEVDGDNVSLGSLSSDDLSEVLDALEDDLFEEIGEEDLGEPVEEDLGACTAFLWFTIRV
ncbi:hypothetical protein C8Q76DRAFT_798071 [Earliella scabrosa]|nr:hypothetical protein C8Q76DRAFT_798071 [Earliella scabrosa]